MTEQERARWTKLVGDFETSDMTQREFASQRGISFSNLRNWIGRPDFHAHPALRRKWSACTPDLNRCADRSSRCRALDRP
jgi:hypothetical protein